MGQGTFGRVFSCWDRVNNHYVAIKVVRAVRKYTQSAKIEIEILNKVQNYGKGNEIKVEKLKIFNTSSEEGSASHEHTQEFDTNILSINHCIKLNSWFTYKGHMCLVFDHCGDSLYDFLKKNHYMSFEIDTIREIAYYIFQSLYYLHNHLQLIHTDLKPENILLESSEVISKTVEDKSYERETSTETSPSRSRSHSRTSSNKKEYLVPASNKIKVIDLGSAIFNHEHHSSIISTRHYRSPEVVLRLGWSYPADIWSVGCILLELFTGNTVFQTHKNVEHLAMMQSLLGSIPQEFICVEKNEGSKQLKNDKIEKYFIERKGLYELDWPQKKSTTKAKKRVDEVAKFSEIIDKKKYPQFYDLVERTLHYDPEKRITAKEALLHPFF